MKDKGKILIAIIGMALGNASPAIEMDELESDNAYVSPTRLKQSPHDIPASVSKISQDTINDLQIKSIPELLKYVAGMISSKASGNQYRINYHGTNGIIPRRMQVLIDGISVYRSSYAEVTWPALPIAISDIDYIEVTRSPSAATYGANSMMAVINIKTKDPLDVDTIALRGGAGSQDYLEKNIYGSGQLFESGRYRFSVSTEKHDGFDLNAADEERRDGTEIERINSKFTFKLSTATSAEVFLGYSDVMNGLESRDSGQISFPDIETKTGFFELDLKHSLSSTHDIRLKTYYTRIEQEQDWNTCYPAILFSTNLRDLFLLNPTYAQSLVNNQLPSGGTAQEDALRDAVLVELATYGPAAFTPVCGNVNEDGYDEKTDVELEDTIIFSESLRAVSGIGISRQTTNADTFLDGRIDNDGYRAFGNVEYRANPFVFNLGGMFEYQSIGNNDVLFSPRAGVNYRLSESLSLRAAVSQAKRTPDILETSANWNYLMRNMSPTNPVTGENEGYFYMNARGDEDLEPEEILSREISLYYRDVVSVQGGNIENILDIRLFNNELTNLISEKLEFSNFNPTNNGEVTLKGFEIEYDYIVSAPVLSEQIDRVHTHFNYAYTDNDTNDFFERSLHANHVGGFFTIVRLKNEWFGSLSYVGHSAIGEETEDIWEIGIGKDTQFGDGYSLELKGKAVYEPDLTHEFIGDINTTVKSINKNETGFYLTFTLSKI